MSDNDLLSSEIQIDTVQYYDDMQQLMSNVNKWAILSGADSFKNELLYKNRFFAGGWFFDKIKEFIDDLNKTDNPFSEISLNQDTILYRARKCDEKFIKNNFGRLKRIICFSNGQPIYFNPQIDIDPERCFWGYESEDCFVPQNSYAIEDARANPKYIKYLYVGSDIQTVIHEVRPSLGSYVNVAEIKINTPMKILKIDPIVKDDSEYEYQYKKCLYDFYSKPSAGELSSYIASQYISEYIKSLDNGTRYDGISYSSSMNSQGTNYTIFNYDKCNPISSNVFLINNVSFNFECVLPYKNQ